MLSISGAAGGALLTAFLITVTEMTEVVAIVYALGAESKHMRPGLSGACAGVAVVGGISLVIGFALTRAAQISEVATLSIGALLLWFFAFFLLRSTFKTYVREDRKSRGVASTWHGESHEGLGPRALFASAFSVGVIESLEACVVLIGLVAAGSVWESVVGAVVGGALLVTLGFFLHERIRKVKVPPLKWVATSMLFTFATFWSLEDAGDLKWVSWPATVLGVPSDILLVPIFLAAFASVAVAVRIRIRLDRASTPSPPSKTQPQ
jgi:uncharacterized membrane protein